MGLSPTSSPPPAGDRPDYYRIPDAECKKCGEPFDACDLAQSLDGLVFNVVKYAVRAGRKPGESAMKDWKKCLSYVNKAIDRQTRRDAKSGSAQDSWSNRKENEADRRRSDKDSI